MINRRHFGQVVGGIAAGVYGLPTFAAESTAATEKIVIGVMGVHGRGRAHTQGFSALPNCEVAYVCDVDSRALEPAQAIALKNQDRKPKAINDFREMLDDKSVDAIAIAAPNHWHAPATILACNAGKHVYVEKPCSHTAEEGELAVAAARKHDRVVTMGNQRRSRATMMEAIKRVHDGELGEVRYSRTWYTNRRGAIGAGKVTEPPSWLDYALWQGPVTERPYKDNITPYNWHWHWHWGNGELGNNGVHFLDIARWGLQVDYPTQVTSAGGRFRFNDDQETADTHLATFIFGSGEKRRMITWESLSWSPYGHGGSRNGISFHGDKASMELLDSGYKIYDMQNKLVEEKKGTGGDAEHFGNFIDCIRSGERPNSDIEGGHKSTLLCHLGNIALRTQSTLQVNPKDGHILENPKAAALWSKDYRKGWEPTV